MTLKFRPHHFLCSLTFKGKGYSEAFTKSFGEIVNQLRSPEGDSTLIDVVGRTDSICEPCPHKRGKRCASQALIDILDQAHAQALKIKTGDTLTWGEAKKRIAQNVSFETFEKICAPCSWKPLGICHKALASLKASKEK